MMDEIASITAHPANTYRRAEDTPVISEKTTKTFKGTRKSDESLDTEHRMSVGVIE